jgi:hypothetical protein
MNPDQSETDICGARTRSGKPCRNKPLKNGRCYVHGGLSTGARNAARPGNTNAQKHGIFSRDLTAEETAMIPAVEAMRGTLDEELVLARIMLNRVLSAWKKADEEGEEKVMELVKIQVVKKRNKATFTITRRCPDFFLIADRFLARIGKLEMMRCGLKLKELEDLLAKLEAALRRIQKLSVSRPN